VGPDAHEGAVRKRQNVHGLEGVEDGRGEVRHPRGLEVAPFHHFGLGVDFEQVNGLAPRVEPHLWRSQCRRSRDAKVGTV